MILYRSRCTTLFDEPKTWLITDIACLIGSNLPEQLLKRDQTGIGLDNFTTETL
jgi:UDP-N-acetylglucosamine 4-epimerase